MVALSGLLVSIAAGAFVAFAQVRDVLQSAKRPTPVLFDHGLSGLDPRAPQAWTNRHCGTCHPHEYKTWKQSRHAVSASNENFQLECLLPDDGRTQFCLNCHAPLNPGGKTYPTVEPDELDEAFAERKDWLVQGVDCLTCHVRDGLVLATRVTEKGRTAHPMRRAPELATAEFCAGCHQFGFKIERIPDAFGGHLQQASFEEFLDVRARGISESSCHDCHMPAGDHLMAGGYSPDMLEQAVSLELSAAWREDVPAVEISIVVEGGHVGHRIPGGEHFRFLTLRTTLKDARGRLISATRQAPAARNVEASLGEKVVYTWPRVETMRRELGPFEHEIDIKAEPIPDTRLWPGERRHFKYLAPLDPESLDGPLLVRTELWYHLMDETKARKVGHSLDEVTWLIQHKEKSLRWNDRP